MCISLGSFRQDPNWLIGERGSFIKYVGPFDQDVDFFVMCEASDKIKMASQFFPEDKINPGYLAHCSQFKSSNRDVGCAVVLTKSVPLAQGGLSSAYLVFFIFGIVVVFPMLFVFRCENTQLRAFNLIKLVFLISVFVIFYLLDFLISAITVVLLLFFFFVQINLSIAPFILGLHSGENAFTNLILKLILALEVIGLAVALILIAPLL